MSLHNEIQKHNRGRKQINFFLPTLASLMILFGNQSFAQINAGPDQTICVPNSATLTATVTPMGGTSTYPVSTIAYAPDPYTTGTAVGLGDDGQTGALPIGFTFCFFGNTYTQFYICSNGWIGFSAGQNTTYVVGAIPNATYARNTIMGPWQDINPGAGGTVRYALYGTAPNRRMAVSYLNVPMYSCTGTLFTGQITIYESTNIIQNYIQTKGICGSWVGGLADQGLHNSTGTVAITVPGRNATQWSATNDGKQYTPSGVSTYTVNWYIGATLVGTGNSITVSPTVTTTYTATVTFLCNSNVYSDDVIVTVGGVTASITSQTNASCNPGNDGTLACGPVGGNPPYTYSWNTAPVQTTQTASGLGAGTYTCTVTDAAGCTATAIVTITQPPAVTAVISAQTNPSCNGNSNGSATVTPGAGSGGFTFSWNTVPIQTTATATNLPSGTYTVTVTDNAGCTATATVTLTQPGGLVLAMAVPTNVSCNGGNNGNATVNPAGGTLPYTYSWTTVPIQTTQTANNLSAGTYTVTVTDLNGCSSTANVTITQPAVLTSSISAQTNVSCFGGNNGSATVSPLGGNGTYTYSWNSAPVQTTVTANNLTAGNYVVTTTDQLGCTTTSSVTITQPPALVISLTSQTNVSCNGGNNGTATVSSVGGTGVVTFSWNTAPLAQVGPTASNLSAGNYTVTATDANGCTATFNVTITQPTLVTITFVSQVNVSCSGLSDGTATVTAGGGTGAIVVSWNSVPAQNGLTATGLPAGTFTATATDANGCTATLNVTITQPAGMATSISAFTNVSCFGGNDGSATVLTNGGSGTYLYSWNTVPIQTTVTATTLTAGTYTCTTSDVNGCTIMANVTITQPAVLTSSMINQTNVSCNGGNDGTVTISVVGGTTPYGYSWTNGQTVATATNLSAGTYSCTVTDANGCTLAAGVVITQPTLLTITLSTQTNVSCFGGTNGTVTVTTGGGTGLTNVSWNTAPVQNGLTASNLQAGNYIATVTDANNCVATLNVTITEPVLLTVAISAQTNVSCFGGSNGTATATPAGGTGAMQYSWNTNPVQSGSIATNLTAGNYSVVVTDAHLCTATANVTITQPTPLISAVTTQTNVLCFGGNNGSATVNVNGGTAPIVTAWNSNPAQNGLTATNLTAGNYIATSTDANGCTITSTVTITQPPLLTVTTTVNPTSICEGQSANLVANFLGGSGGVTYIWTPGNMIGPGATVSPLTTTQYTVSVTDGNGCNAVSAPIQLTVNPLPVIAVTPDLLFGCAPLTVNFTDQTVVTGGSISSWSWNFGNHATSTQTNPSATYDSLGTFTVSLTVVSNAGCSQVATFGNLIRVYPKPVASFTVTPDHPSDSDPKVYMHNSSTHANHYVWNFGETTYNNSVEVNPEYTYHDVGSYTIILIASNQWGCADTAFVQENVLLDFNFYIPNAFTPNDDGKNDTFIGFGRGVVDFEMDIFSRWGELIYSTTDMNSPWDGKLSGGSDTWKEDVYVYIMKVKDISGTDHAFKGKVSLIR